MSVTHQDFLVFARALADGPGEIEWRNSTARAYYSAYHCASSVVDLCPPNSHFAMGSHERLSERFKAHGTKGSKSIAYVLEAMKKNRVAADYEISDPFEKSSAVNQVAQTDVFIQKVTSFKNECKPHIP